MVEVVVEYEYLAKEDDELTLKPGSIVVNVTKMEGGWWEGTLDGKRGMFPDNFVKEIKKDKAKDPPAVSQPAKKSHPAGHGGAGGHVADMANRLGKGGGIKLGPAPATTKRTSLQEPKKTLAKVTFAYAPEQDDELKLDVGDTIEVTKQMEEGWWEGICDGKMGMFPSNFVKLIEEEEKEVTVVTSPTEDTNIPEGEVHEIKGRKIKGVGLGNIFGDGPIKLRSVGSKDKEDEHSAVRPAAAVETKSAPKAKKTAPPPVPVQPPVPAQPPALPPKEIKEPKSAFVSDPVPDEVGLGKECKPVNMFFNMTGESMMIYDPINTSIIDVDDESDHYESFASIDTPESDTMLSLTEASSKYATPEGYISRNTHGFTSGNSQNDTNELFDSDAEEESTLDEFSKVWQEADDIPLELGALSLVRETPPPKRKSFLSRRKSRGSRDSTPVNHGSIEENIGDHGSVGKESIDSALLKVLSMKCDNEKLLDDPICKHLVSFNAEEYVIYNPSSLEASHEGHSTVLDNLKSCFVKPKIMDLSSGDYNEFYREATPSDMLTPLGTEKSLSAERITDSVKLAKHRLSLSYSPTRKQNIQVSMMHCLRPKASLAGAFGGEEKEPEPERITSEGSDLPTESVTRDLEEILEKNTTLPARHRSAFGGFRDLQHSPSEASTASEKSKRSSAFKPMTRHLSMLNPKLLFRKMSLRRLTRKKSKEVLEERHFQQPENYIQYLSKTHRMSPIVSRVLKRYDIYKEGKMDGVYSWYFKTYLQPSKSLECFTEQRGEPKDIMGPPVKPPRKSVPKRAQSEMVKGSAHPSALRSTKSHRSGSGENLNGEPKVKKPKRKSSIFKRFSLRKKSSTRIAPADKGTNVEQVIADDELTATGNIFQTEHPETRHTAQDSELQSSNDERYHDEEEVERNRMETHEDAVPLIDLKDVDDQPTGSADSKPPKDIMSERSPTPDKKSHLKKRRSLLEMMNPRRKSSLKLDKKSADEAKEETKGTLVLTDVSDAAVLPNAVHLEETPEQTTKARRNLLKSLSPDKSSAKNTREDCHDDENTENGVSDTNSKDWYPVNADNFSMEETKVVATPEKLKNQKKGRFRLWNSMRRSSTRLPSSGQEEDEIGAVGYVDENNNTESTEHACAQNVIVTMEEPTSIEMQDDAKSPEKSNTETKKTKKKRSSLFTRQHRKKSSPEVETKIKTFDEIESAEQGAKPRNKTKKKRSIFNIFSPKKQSAVTIVTEDTKQEPIAVCSGTDSGEEMTDIQGVPSLDLGQLSMANASNISLKGSIDNPLSSGEREKSLGSPDASQESYSIAMPKDTPIEEYDQVFRDIVENVLGDKWYARVEQPTCSKEFDQQGIGVTSDEVSSPQGAESSDSFQPSSCEVQSEIYSQSMPETHSPGEIITSPDDVTSKSSEEQAERDPHREAAISIEYLMPSPRQDDPTAANFSYNNANIYDDSYAAAYKGDSSYFPSYQKSRSYEECSPPYHAMFNDISSGSRDATYNSKDASYNSSSSRPVDVHRIYKTHSQDSSCGGIEANGPRKYDDEELPLLYSDIMELGPDETWGQRREQVPTRHRYDLSDLKLDDIGDVSPYKEDIEESAYAKPQHGVASMHSSDDEDDIFKPRTVGEDIFSMDNPAHDITGLNGEDSFNISNLPNHSFSILEDISRLLPGLDSYTMPIIPGLDMGYDEVDESPQDLEDPLGGASYYPPEVTTCTEMESSVDAEDMTAQPANQSSPGISGLLSSVAENAQTYYSITGNLRPPVTPEVGPSSHQEHREDASECQGPQLDVDYGTEV